MAQQQQQPRSEKAEIRQNLSEAMADLAQLSVPTSALNREGALIDIARNLGAIGPRENLGNPNAGQTVEQLFSTKVLERLNELLDASPPDLSGARKLVRDLRQE